MRWWWLLLVVVVAGAVRAQTDIVDVATYEQCIIDAQLLRDTIDLGNISCTDESVGITAVTLAISPSSLGGLTLQINMTGNNRTDAEKVATNSQQLYNEEALVEVMSSQVRTRFQLDKRGLVPHAYVEGGKKCGTDPCGRKDRADKLDGRNFVLYCPSRRGSITAAGGFSDGVLGDCGEPDSVIHNDLWPANLGCKYLSGADFAAKDPGDQATFPDGGDRWYYAFIGGTLAESGLRGGISEPEIEFDDGNNWILEAPAPGDPFVNRKISCRLEPNNIYYLPVTSGVASSYYPPSGRFRNMLFVQDRIPSRIVAGERLSDCRCIRWKFCNDQSAEERAAGEPCRTYRFGNERHDFAFGSCWGTACQSVYRLIRYESLRVFGEEYLNDFNDISEETAGNDGARGGLVSPTCTGGRISNNPSTLDQFPWPNNFANTPRISPLINVNQEPLNDDAATAAEGRTFDAYGAPGTCARTECAICLAKLGPMRKMDCDSNSIMSWQFPIYERFAIREIPLLETNLTVRVTPTNSTPRIFELGKAEVVAQTNERFVLSSQFFDPATQAVFRASIININVFGSVPTQNGEILAINDRWRPGGVISLDEAVDYAVRAIERDGQWPSTLSFAELSTIFDPREQPQQVLAQTFGRLPDPNFRAYPCCDEPALYSVNRLAMLRSLYPQIDNVPELTLVMEQATVFRSVARPGAQQYGNRGRGLYDGPVDENPFAPTDPPSSGWMWINAPEDRVRVGPFCHALGVTNEYWQVGENVARYCRSGQLGVCMPGIDIVTADATRLPDEIRARRLAEYQALCDSPDGCYSSGISYLPPNLQFNDGRLRVWTCEGSLCFDAVDDYGMTIELQLIFSGDLIRVIRDLPPARFVELTDASDQCNVTIGDDGVLFAEVENIGSLPGEFSVTLDCRNAAFFDVLSSNPQTRGIDAGASERFEFIIRGSGPNTPRIETCFLILRDAIGGVLAQQDSECSARVNTAIVPPATNITFVPVDTADFGSTVPDWALILMTIGGLILALLIIWGLTNVVRGAKRWVYLRQLKREQLKSRQEINKALAEQSVRANATPGPEQQQQALLARQTRAIEAQVEQQKALTELFKSLTK